ncbi:MAG: UDP-N-acetylmuramoyl-L-alanyl-D-glutamate--2,6-diaminopimelate ligase [Acidimicrobiales bacterium]|nr:UDP-N-acetylmuramoyl-L-alanyl-D-glutamate--2,6-diaminopimelate ligase [Acidimicrobiales bacterium]
MRLGSLLSAAGINATLLETEAASIEVARVSHDSRSVQSGDLFCCVPGASHDGHDFASEAVRCGASVLVCERPLGLTTPTVIVPSVREAMPLLAAAIHGWPSRHLSLVGVTGTNGKTSVVHLLSWILARSGMSTEVHGTLSGGRTTPEATDLQSMFGRWVSDGVEAAAIEVSSHALAQHRVDGTHFALVGFTNLSRDHLDFHTSMSDYETAKARLFDGSFSTSALVMVDTPAGRRMAVRASEAGMDVTEVEVATAGGVIRSDGVGFEWRGHPVEVSTPGRFTIANALLAAEMAAALGLGESDVVDGLSSAPPVPGRFEPVPLEGGPMVVVDYAHTPDALSAALATARQIVAGRLLVVLGCGGGRDRGKRPEMGRIALAGSDMVVVTSDNPRDEPPEGVIADILSGMDSAPSLVEPDRRLAIAAALRLAGPDDLVLIAGKGHEDTQESEGRFEPFDDRVTARREWARMSAAGDVG